MSSNIGRIGVAGLAVGAVLLGAAGSATAKVAPENRAAAAAPAPNSITGAMVKDGTLYAADINPAVVKWFTGTFDNTVTSASVKDGSLNLADFSAAAKAGLKGDKGDTGAQGSKGDPGDTGAQGLKGDQGDTGPQGLKGDQGGTGAQGLKGDQGVKGDPGAPATWAGKHWGTVLRNTLGSGSAELKATSTTAPVGDGALEINTASATDKASFGNEVDFQDNEVGAITKVGYSVYTTGENIARAATGNMPSITFEINPHLSTSASTYSSMVFAPGNTTANVWTTVDATDDSLGKVWGLTGAGMPCGINGARCTWSELQTALSDGGAPATVYTLAVGKGRDYEFHGAVDKLTYNSAVFDFEPTGVK
jgi:hypothetical protein